MAFHFSSSILYSGAWTSDLFLGGWCCQIASNVSAILLVLLVGLHVAANLIVDFDLVQIVRISIWVHYIVVFVRVVLFAGNAFIMQRSDLVTNGAALAPTVNVRAVVVILHLVRLRQELSSLGLTLTQRYLGPQLWRRHIVIINFLRWN